MEQRQAKASAIHDQSYGAARWRPFFAVAFALTVLMVGTNIPTPLYPVYARAFGFSPLVVTLIFATYAAVLMPSLLVFGPLSDVVGRRRLLLFAVAVSAVGAVVFAFATSTASLFLARVIQGLGVGAAQGVAAAALADAEPNGNSLRAALVASIATAGGTALGPLLGGALAQYAPLPTRLAYGVEMLLLLMAFVGVLLWLPRGALHGGPWRLTRPSVPRTIRRAFAVAGSTAFLAWAVAGLFLALMPGYVIQLTKVSNLALTGGRHRGADAGLLGRRAAERSPHRSGTGADCRLGAVAGQPGWHRRRRVDGIGVHHLLRHCGRRCRHGPDIRRRACRSRRHGARAAAWGALVGVFRVLLCRCFTARDRPRLHGTRGGPGFCRCRFCRRHRTRLRCSLDRAVSYGRTWTAYRRSHFRFLRALNLRR